MVRVEETAPWRAFTAPRVLMYHFFGRPLSGRDPDHLFVTARDFRAQLGSLLGAGWQPVDLDSYLGWWAGSGVRLPRKSFLLTIDDAHRSVVDLAAPVLASFGVPSVLFVPSGLIGGAVCWSEDYTREPIATADELRRLPATGMELGVHGFDHTRMVPLDPTDLRLHTADARLELERVTGIRARAFAYPYGTHDPTARRAVEEAGFAVSFAVAREHGTFARWRICVDGNDSRASFRFKLTPMYAAASLLGGRAWRARHLVRDRVESVCRATGAGTERLRGE
jgi:peptidoglycan/xylan/chitin deacetylase (PgdA/CDA1 family)